MEDFPSNAKNPQGGRPRVEREEEPKPKIGKIVETPVTRRKKPLGKRFVEMFFGNAKNAANFVVLDILVPAAQDTAAEMGKQFLEGIVYPEGSSRRRRSGGSGYGLASRGGHNTPYDRMSNRGPRRDPRERDDRRMSSRGRSLHDFDDLIFATRAEAVEVLDTLEGLIRRFKEVTVADLYAMADTEADYTDTQWGWTSLPGAGVDRARGGGYVLDLPRPIPLD